ncbi:MAG: hypothetical protein IJ448_01455 [Oscillospiraceae bacterium]|nr:hypothetical protein [Oscillospiraceae bacterium]
MKNAERLVVLKSDLELLTNAKDSYLTHLLQVAEERIKAEGITLTESVGDEDLRIMYAAYLYRKRAAELNAMPRMLRYALNNRLVQQKGGTASVT